MKPQSRKKKSTTSHKPNQEQVNQEKDNLHPIAHLLKYGYCVVKCIHFESNYLSDGFDQSLREQPELYTDAIGDIPRRLMDPPYVGGGFAALGNASSFHNNYVRLLRKKNYSQFCQLISEYESLGNEPLPYQKIEIVPDRMLYRCTHQAPSSESCHRDLSPTQLTNCNKFVQSNPTDLILGGWINCNETETQQFICVPQTHIQTDLVIGQGQTGFQLLTKSESDYYKTLIQTIFIPPGYFMLFNQNLIHFVQGHKLSYDLKRLFISYRFSQSTNNTPLILDIEQRLHSGSIIPLKSGQIPSMFPRLYIVNWQNKLIELSEKFPSFMKVKTELTSNKITDANKKVDNMYDILMKEAPNVIPNTPYHEEEIQLYLPHLFRNGIKRTTNIGDSSSSDDESIHHEQVKQQTLKRSRSNTRNVIDLTKENDTDQTLKRSRKSIIT
jgi:hypothetical protein